ncbi:T9SS type A sorting domain-containing protein [Chryseobacterium rhizosphaerae]|uniref:T9SS type A sorting domain-containing protein n=1 Tax=Chryseobacterium rhizosphaerae TaxID=395937 RepID=UPI003D0B38DC
MKKILFTLSVSCFSMAYTQTLNFSDVQFKALLLSANPTNQIAKDLNGNNIVIDQNGDGEIQLPEALQVKILNIKVDADQMYINPAGDRYDPNNINSTYYNSHLPDGISDALLFSNLEELYFWNTRTANISFINNGKIKKVQGRPFYYDLSQSGQYTAAPINLSFDNCQGIQNITDIIAYQATGNPWYSPENSLSIKNCQQINSNAIIDSAELKELHIQNSSITSLTFNSCKFLSKISVPSLSTLTKISVLGDNGTFSSSNSQDIELIANNCTNLQEIIADTDHYSSTGAYFSAVNLNGSTSLKKIKGLNAPTIDFSIAGLVNLEELDCSFYNRYGYNTTSGIYFGNVNALNLAGLPKLKILKAFNQKISNTVNFSTAQALENIDITNSCGYMNTVNVSNLASLTTLKTGRIEAVNTQGNDDLQKITAKNCTSLANFIFNGNSHLKELDIQNCTAIQKIAIGYYVIERDGVFPELNSINLLQCTGIKEITIHNTEINTLNTSQCSALKTLELKDDNLLSSIDISNNFNLESITLQSLPLISQVNTLNNIKLKTAFISNSPQITQLNFSTATNFEGLSLWNMPNLTYVNIRNGSIEELHDYNGYNTNLQMCVDDAQLSDLQSMYPDITFTANCGSFLQNRNVKANIKSFQVFPNPVKDILQVNSDSVIKNIKIVDTQSRIIFNQDFNQELIKIDLSSYPNSVYIMKITTDKGQVTEKIIKR